MSSDKKNIISTFTLNRLADYLCMLYHLKDKGIKKVSSNSIAEMMKLTDSQIRKDISYFGSFGKKGFGYDIESLIKAIEEILNLNNPHNVCIIGIGHLGTALINNKKFNHFPFKIIAGFDIDKKKIGTVFKNTPIYNTNRLNEIIDNVKCEIIILTLPSTGVNRIYQELKSTKIKSIPNFTSVMLLGNDRISVRNLNLINELRVLSYYLKEK